MSANSNPVARVGLTRGEQLMTMPASDHDSIDVRLLEDVRYVNQKQSNPG